MRIPKAIQNVIESFEKLPGIGPKTAQRLTFYLLHVPQHQLDQFAASLQHLKTKTIVCSICHTVDETNPCSICSDPKRDKEILCVVEQPLDVLALEKSGKYTGVYHVLHGRIDPLNNIGPDEIFIRQLIERVTKRPRQTRLEQRDNGTEEIEVKEVILATNPTMEGEATAMYIAKQLRVDPPADGGELKITRIGRGLPIGADLEYADSSTLDRAMEGRSSY